MNSKRMLVYQFNRLPYVIRLGIVTKLKLVSEEDRDLKEEAKQIQYFRRAEQNGILDQLWNAVKQHHCVEKHIKPTGQI